MPEKYCWANLLVATYRNQSLDDFMTEMMQLRSELNSIGNNFNQAVKKAAYPPANCGVQKLDDHL